MEDEAEFEESELADAFSAQVDEISEEAESTSVSAKEKRVAAHQMSELSD